MEFVHELKKQNNKQINGRAEQRAGVMKRYRYVSLVNLDNSSPSFALINSFSLSM